MILYLCAWFRFLYENCFGSLGKIDLFERSKELKAKVSNAKIIFVVYDSYSKIVGGGGGMPPPELSTTSAPDDTAKTGTLGDGGSSQLTGPGGSGAGNTELSDLVSVVSKKLAQNGCRVATLKGTYLHLHVQSIEQ